MQLDFNSSIGDEYVEFIVSDTSGITFMNLPKHRLIQGENHVSLDCSGLPDGEYAFLFYTETTEFH